MKTYSLFITLFFCLAFTSCKEEDPISPPNTEINLSETEIQLIELLNAETHTIGANPLSIPDEALSSLDRLADVKIVGLGEATHGTAEFFQMKHRIFQYLVEHHDYKAFIFEMDLAEALIFNDWIQGKNDQDLASLMRDKMIFWTWRTQEVQALFEWMRDYNEQQPEDQKIYLYGVDTQYPNYDVDALTARMFQLDPALADSIRRYNRSYKMLHDLYPQKNQADADEIDAGIVWTTQLIQAQKENIITQLSEEDFKWMERLAIHMEQTARYQYEYYFLDEYGLRDQYMAENTNWYFDLLGADSKLVLWAHNGHVGKNQFYGSSPSQGGHLANVHGNDYQVIGFGFSKGQFTAFGNGLRTHTINTIPVRDSYNFIFNQAESSNFILDLDLVGDPVLRSWLSARKHFLQLGSVFNFSAANYYYPMPIRQYFDFMIYFDQTRASVIL